MRSTSERGSWHMRAFNHCSLFIFIITFILCSGCEYQTEAEKVKFIRMTRPPVISEQLDPEQLSTLRNAYDGLKKILLKSSDPVNIVKKMSNDELQNATFLLTAFDEEVQDDIMFRRLLIRILKDPRTELEFFGVTDKSVTTWMRPSILDIAEDSVSSNNRRMFGIRILGLSAKDIKNSAVKADEIALATKIANDRDVPYAVRMMAVRLLFKHGSLSRERAIEMTSSIAAEGEGDSRTATTKTMLENLQ